MTPSKFTLFGHEWNVSYNPHLARKEGLIGKCDYENKHIELQPDCDEYDISESVVEQTFYHELVHAILDELSLPELRSDERIVDNISQLLYQFETTKKEFGKES